jgi:hypothetical protein
MARNSASQPGGTSSRGRPGAALMPTAGTQPGSSRHQSSGGSLVPARSRRSPDRRAGSMNTASGRSRPPASWRTSAHTAAT